MQRTRFSILAGFLYLFAVVACSDNTTGIKPVPRASKSAVVTLAGTLDQNVVAILALFPKGLANAATTRWDNVKRKYAAGLTDPSQMTVAKQMLFELSAWVISKSGEMDTPPDGETRTAGAARLVLYMSMYVYGARTLFLLRSLLVPTLSSVSSLPTRRPLSLLPRCTPGYSSKPGASPKTPSSW